MKNNIQNIFKYLIIITVSTSLSSCISYRPIFDPNNKYRAVGEDKAQSDADICIEEAGQYLKASKRRRAAKQAARGVGWGSILGGIFGFIFGGDVKGLVKGATIGAGTGAVTGGGGVIAEDNLKPDQIKQRYVANCLGKKGYSIIGWE